MYCPKCNTVIPESGINVQTGIAMCSNCKEIFKLADLSPPAPPPPPPQAPAQASGFCMRCGKPLGPGSKFCTGCGALVEAPPSLQAAPIQPSQYQQPQYTPPVTQPQQGVAASSAVQNSLPRKRNILPVFTVVISIIFSIALIIIFSNALSFNGTERYFNGIRKSFSSPLSYIALIGGISTWGLIFLTNMVIATLIATIYSCLSLAKNEKLYALFASIFQITAAFNCPVALNILSGSTFTDESIVPYLIIDGVFIIPAILNFIFFTKSKFKATQGNQQPTKIHSGHNVLITVSAALVFILVLLTSFPMSNFLKSHDRSYNRAERFYSKGQREYSSGNFANAIADYSRAISIMPSSKYYNSRAYSYFLLGTPQKGLEDANESIQLSSNFPSKEYYDTRGSIYRALGEYDKALADYTEALRLDPNYAFVYMNRALTHWWKNQNRAAYEADRKKALDIDPKQAARVYTDIGISRYNSGKYSDAVGFFNNALELNPEDSRILSWKAVAEAKAK